MFGSFWKWWFEILMIYYWNIKKIWKNYSHVAVCFTGCHSYGLELVLLVDMEVVWHTVKLLVPFNHFYISFCGYKILCTEGWHTCLNCIVHLYSQAVADIIRTTLGPRSMLKMLLDAAGGNSSACALLTANWYMWKHLPLCLWHHFCHSNL